MAFCIHVGVLASGTSSAGSQEALLYERRGGYFEILYDNQSYVPKGVTNRFLSVRKFNPKSEACWSEFAEYYYNMVPDNPNTVIQNVYVFESRDAVQIKDIQQYKANRSKLKLLAIGYLNQKKAVMTFKRLL